MTEQSRRENRRVIRLKLAKPLKILLTSIGGTVRYEMQTRNVSYTGFFLDFEKPGRFPFTPASIMEIWLELGDQTLFFNGKMVRKVMPGDPGCEVTGPGIAVRIVQIDSKTENLLKDFVDKHLDQQEVATFQAPKSA
ncbi:MAG: PilZ domain-containing protein [Proteobacteria bacterium]|nr:PilZ domain-containing protein [Pseudomonadota bacterium]